MKILTPRKLNSMLALLSAVLMLSCSSSEEYIEPPTEPEPPTEIEGEEKTILRPGTTRCVPVLIHKSTMS